jgi:hypothetical protein
LPDRSEPRTRRAAVRAAIGLVAALTAAAATSGCLVLALQPAYDDASLAWDPALAGTWIDDEDRVTVAIDRGEWKSYRIEYEHPIEKGVLTGYLTVIDGRQYLDVVPVRGQDYGSFLVPVHAILRIERTGDTLTVQALDYDRFATAARKGGLEGLAITMDQKQNALVTEPTAGLRKWLARTAATPDVWFGARAVFKRKAD